MVRPSELYPRASDGPRHESIASGNAPALEDFLPHIEIRPLVGAWSGARGLSTFTAELKPGAKLPLHRHDCGEAVTVLDGRGIVDVAGEEVTLERLDCLFLPAGLAHAVRNVSDNSLVVHSAFASPEPRRDLVDEADSQMHVRSSGFCLRRVRGGTGYDLGGGTEFHDLFASRFGSEGICGGWARFEPGSSLPCHFHEYDESITIVEGRAACEVEGRRYELSGCDTALVPKGLRHRFLNLSQAPMAMIWVYAGDEPSRTVVDSHCCSDGSPIPRRT